MFAFAKRFFAPAANPIGVDFGSDALRMAQVRVDGAQCHLAAAACADVPSHVRNDPTARLAFFVQTARDLLSQGGFIGRQAILSLPASSTFIQHLRLAKMDEDATTKALVWEARGKLPIDPSMALMRHLIAGEVYQDQELRNEIILMAAARDGVHRLLDAASSARLQVVAMNVEPRAVLDCFGHLQNRHDGAEASTCFVDLGCVASRVVIANRQQILFARIVPIGGDHFTRAVSNAMAIGFEEAKMLRIRLAAAQDSADTHARDRASAQSQSPSAQPVQGLQSVESRRVALLGAAVGSGSPADARSSLAVAEAPDDSAEVEPPDQAQSQQVDQACQEPLSRLIEELDLCRSYYEATFPSKPIDRLVFIGGEARQRHMCQQLAQGLGLAAQIGDPLARMGRSGDLGVEYGIDRRHPQPAWAVAVGLSLGPVLPEHAGEKHA